MTAAAGKASKAGKGAPPRKRRPRRTAKTPKAGKLASTLLTAQELLASEAATIMLAAIEKAYDGDGNFLKMLFERVAPAPVAGPAQFDGTDVTIIIKGGLPEPTGGPEDEVPPSPLAEEDGASAPPSAA